MDGRGGGGGAQKSEVIIMNPRTYELQLRRASRRTRGVRVEGENKMETTIVYWGYNGVILGMEKKMETMVLHWDYVDFPEPFTLLLMSYSLNS